MNNSFSLVVNNSSPSKKSSRLHFSLTVTYGLEEERCSLCCMQCHAVLKAQKDFLLTEIIGIRVQNWI